MYSIDTESGRLRKVAARLEVAQGTTEIVLSDHRALAVSLPRPKEVVAADKSPDILARLDTPNPSASNTPTVVSR